MNPSLTFEAPKATNPQEEISRLREAATVTAERAKENGAEMTAHDAAAETVKQYAAATPREVLHPCLRYRFEMSWPILQLILQQWQCQFLCSIF